MLRFISRPGIYMIFIDILNIIFKTLLSVIPAILYDELTIIYILVDQ